MNILFNVRYDVKVKVMTGLKYIPNHCNKRLYETYVTKNRKIYYH